VSEKVRFLTSPLRGTPRWVRPGPRPSIHTGKRDQGMARPRRFDKGPYRHIEGQVNVPGLLSPERERSWPWWGRSDRHHPVFPVPLDVIRRYHVPPEIPHSLKAQTGN